MRTDVLELHDFYRTALGRMARRAIGARIGEAWGTAPRMRVAGFGYAEPFLGAFTDAERKVAFAPATQGVAAWPEGEPGRVALVDECHWPAPDAFFDRILMIHGLEEAQDPRRLLREIWRVLADDGRLMIVTANRRGAWSMVESTPFAAGRPYLRRQLTRLLSETMFKPTAYSSALYFPPMKARFLLRAAGAWERAGARLWPGLGGAVLVEAAKSMAVPVARPRPVRVFSPAAATAGARVRRDGDA